jgi:tetratricopeptide (TPR) repeat protein
VGRTFALPRPHYKPPTARPVVQDQPWSPPLYATLAIIGVGLTLRLIAVWQLDSLPLSRTPQLESAEYLAWARRIAELGFVWPVYPEHAPGYPFFLGGLLAVFNGSLTAVRLVQAVLGALACVLTARVAARTLSPAAFLPAGLLQAAYGPLIYLDAAILPESLLVFLIVWSLDIVTAPRQSARRWLWGGLVLGAACVVRPTALVLIPAYLIVLAIKRERPRRPLRLAGAFTAGAVVVIGAVMIQNAQVSGAPMLQAYGGPNFYLGNRPSGDGVLRARLGGEWDQLQGDASRASTERSGQDAFYFRRAMSEIGDRPLGYLRVLGTKLLWTVQAIELRDTHSFEFFRQASPLLRWLPAFGLIAALAAIGAYAAPRRDAALLIGALIAVTMTVVFLAAGLRYRIPLVPMLVAFAGAGVAVLVEIVRKRDWRALAAPIGLAVAMSVLTHVRSDAASLNVGEEWALTGLSLLQESDLNEAEAAYRIAVELDPESSFAWDGLGLVQQQRGAAQPSIDAHAKAVAINPGNASAWLHLGIVRERTGDLRGALDAYRSAIAITPDRTEIVTALGLGLLAAGSPRDAEPLLQKSDARGDVVATLGLGDLAMQRRDARNALRYAQRAVSLEPSQRAWSLMMQALLVNRQYDQADRALLEAQRAGLPAAEVTRLRGILSAARGK